MGNRLLLCVCAAFVLQTSAPASMISQTPASKAPQVPSWPRDTEPAERAAVKPAPASPQLQPYIGQYGDEKNPVIVLERAGALAVVVDRGAAVPVAATAFAKGAKGAITTLTLDGRAYARLHVGPENGGQLKIAPVGSVAASLKQTITETPPAETGDFLPSALVEVATLDPTIKLDIRYATTNNFLGSVFYPSARAFLQRPAAEAVVHASAKLRALGYGLLIHDGYRPWYVTKTFWDMTPVEKHWLVADPSKGSKHNRGCAVDLTLYDLKTGRVIEMPSTYDESTPRAYAFYPGGTSLERWHRALLRQVMEAEGFTVNPEEWWHFDYKDWPRYRIGNTTW